MEQTRVPNPLFASAWQLPRALTITLALSVLAHLVAYFGAPDFVTAWRATESTKFDAVLVAAAPAVVPETAPPEPVAPRPVVKPRVKLAKVVPVTPVLISPAEAIPNNTPTEPPASTEPDLVPLPPLASAAMASLEPVVIASAPELTLPPSGKAVDFPQRLRATYKMTSSIANGTASLSWQLEGTKYEIDSSIQPTGVFTSMFVGNFRQISRGEMTDSGIRPNFFSLQRGDVPADTAEFQRAAKTLKIIKHGETHISPLSERLQDTQSFLFQMARDVSVLGKGSTIVPVQVTNARKIYEYKFKRIGEATLATPVGTFLTIHLKSEASDPEDVYEVWLAPDLHFMPVKMKFFMGRFPVEQNVATFASSALF